MYFKFLASEALHCTLYHAEHFSKFQPWMSIVVAPVEHVQLLKGKYSKKKWHTELVSVELNIHPNMRFPGLFFCGSYALVSACFASCNASFVSPRGAEGTVTLGMFPEGCEDTVACRWLLFRGGGVSHDSAHSTTYLHSSIPRLITSLQDDRP